MIATTTRTHETAEPQDYRQLAHRIMILINTYLQPGEFHDPYSFRVKRYTLVLNTATQQVDLKSAWQIANDERALITLSELFQAQLTTDLHEADICQLLQQKLTPKLANLD
ncbi:hypothetical protein [Lapidilactobacillus wuchangensis]|uniref:hypothetical protein n=1 Tax=Lapidilactobacillus wuchangensis TaxID=2486001 RepID=UPI000F78B737|nr:hypothetical protein [Lapidilactobacillus wuchangensis]